MIIRHATVCDVDAIAAVHVASWDAAKEGLDLPTRRTIEVRRERWAAYLAAGEGTLQVADVAWILGFIAYGPSRDADRRGEAEIYTLYVAPEAWGKGVGSALMEGVSRDTTVSLWVAERNVRAQAFYARHGFTPDGSREGGLHLPVVRLTRDGR
ncbi:MAG: GNAT family N-acetyltransferase [Actinobacteria bacterium]|nr:GNAT family N-acetyltransferase [Actinomycetota bacterium]